MAIHIDIDAALAATRPLQAAGDWLDEAKRQFAQATLFPLGALTLAHEAAAHHLSGASTVGAQAAGELVGRTHSAIDAARHGDDAASVHIRALAAQSSDGG